MNSRANRLVPLALISVLVGVTGCAASPTGQPTLTPEPASTAQPLNGNVGLTVVASPVKNAACNPNAVATVAPGASEADRTTIENNPASNRHAGAASLGDANSAVQAARTASATDAQARSHGWTPPAKQLAAAIRLSYQDSLKAVGADIPEGHQIVNPQRCVWLVTLDEPYIQQHVKPGMTPEVYNRYTRVIDQATGEGLDLYAGSDAPDAITGEHL